MNDVAVFDGGKVVVGEDAAAASLVGAVATADAEVKGAASDPIYALEKALTRITSLQSN